MLDRIVETLPLTWLDVAALVLFATAWAVYQWYADYSATPRPRLGREMDRFTQEWLVQMAGRDNRMVDVNVLRNLTRSSQFFASTTMLILGALVALMGYAEQAASVVAELPFTHQASRRLWEMKILAMLLIFVYAFFKFTWAIRQYNYCCALIGAAPPVSERIAPERRAAIARQAAEVLSVAVFTFNGGLRAYYFAFAAISWFVNPTIFVVATVVVVGILYVLEFRSNAVKVLGGGLGDG